MQNHISAGLLPFDRILIQVHILVCIYCVSFYLLAGNEFSASTSLADFLREKRVSMGTKVMCRQGGCGICIVEAKMQLQAGQRKVAANLNSVSMIC